MMDLFEEKNISPMLIGATGEAFEDNRYIYEIKFDGERAIAYLDKSGTELRNKRNKRMLPVFPELSEIHEQVNRRCILDGEYICLIDGKPSFAEVQRRSLMGNNFKIKLASGMHPVSFIAFDILYLDGQDLTGRPLVERKELLRKTVIENDRIAVSTVFKSGGIDLYKLTEQQGLEGIVAKRKDSLYVQGKRTKNWVKIKNMMDDDFVILGWIPKQNHMTSIILGKYNQAAKLVYKGHVTLGVGGANFSRIKECSVIPPLFNPVPKGNEQARWIEPTLVCTVEFMEGTSSGGMRQPVFKGLRPDKQPEEVVE